MVWTYVYPKHDEITSPQRAYLHGALDRLESLMRAADWAHPVTGYRGVLDVPSWIDALLVQELSKNYDAYWRSLYFHKQSQAHGGRIYMGPLWDFDLAFGNCNLENAWRSDGWAWDLRNTLWLVRKLVKEDPAFQRELKCRWKALRAGPLSKPSFDRRIDGMLASLMPALARDRARWPLATRVRTYAYGPAGTADDVKWLRDWIDARLRWMDANLPGLCP